MQDEFRLTDASSCGTSKKAQLLETHLVLEELFGEPNGGSCDKTDFCWVFEHIETGEIFTIYNYRDLPLYYDPYMWSIGGKTDASRFKEWVNSSALLIRSAMYTKEGMINIKLSKYRKNKHINHNS